MDRIFSCDTYRIFVCYLLFKTSHNKEYIFVKD